MRVTMRTKLSVVKKGVSMKAGMKGSNPVTFTGLRCDTESCKTW